MGHARIPYPPTQVDNTKVGVLQFLVAAEVIVLEPNDVCGATAPFFSPQRLSVDMDECFLWDELFVVSGRSLSDLGYLCNFV